MVYTYEASDESGVVVNRYLSKITYGYNNLYTVDFDWESRNDVRVNYKSNFRINNNKKLGFISIKYNNAEIKKYQLNYISNNSSKTILSGINEINVDESSNEIIINEFAFDYEINKNDSGYISSTMNKMYSSSNTYDNCSRWDLGCVSYTKLMDMNNDNLLDKITYKDYDNVSGGGFGLFVGLNNGHNSTALNKC